jgi:hypothetical protein
VDRRTAGDQCTARRVCRGTRRGTRSAGCRSVTLIWGFGGSRGNARSRVSASSASDRRRTGWRSGSMCFCAGSRSGAGAGSADTSRQSNLVDVDATTRRWSLDSRARCRTGRLVLILAYGGVVCDRDGATAACLASEETVEVFARRTVQVATFGGVFEMRRLPVGRRAGRARLRQPERLHRA